MTTVQIRPEQAARLLALHAEMATATDRFVLATQVAVAGLAGPEASVKRIERNGTVTLTEPDQGGPSA